ncbi:ABC-three component system protein [Luteibacter sp.]|uniref:ABC-three component system protein n=1 Tax=Luteibacter sp. TaxID=1886636 RepID=UPI003F7DB35E
MLRSMYAEFCAEKLTALAGQVETLGRLNVLHLHTHCETFYLHLLNLIFGLKLINLNTTSQNAPGIDLIDESAGLAIQVSATATKDKIEGALARDYTAYKVDRFQFISICKDASKLRKQVYENVSGLSFDPVKDIHDVISIMNCIVALRAIDQAPVYEFIKSEFVERRTAKLQSTLGAMIVKLAEAEAISSLASAGLPFAIDEKIDHNKLIEARRIIQECAPYTAKVDAIYAEFDRLGNNKSRSVFLAILALYASTSDEASSDKRFLKLVSLVVGRFSESEGFAGHVAMEDAEFAAAALVVHAFMNCKVFDRPPGVVHALA